MSNWYAVRTGDWSEENFWSTNATTNGEYGSPADYDTADANGHIVSFGSVGLPDHITLVGTFVADSSRSIGTGTTHCTVTGGYIKIDATVRWEAYCLAYNCFIGVTTGHTLSVLGSVYGGGLNVDSGACLNIYPDMSLTNYGDVYVAGQQLSEAEAGTYPAEANVSSVETQWGPTGTEYSGQLDLTNLATTNIKSGTVIGSITGNYYPLVDSVFPAEANVSSIETLWGPTGTEYAGELNLTNLATTNIKSGTVIGSITGNYYPLVDSVFPAEANVSSVETQWGPTGDEYAGTLDLTNLATTNVKTGVVIGGVTGNYSGTVTIITTVVGAAGSSNRGLKKNVASQHFGFSLVDPTAGTALNTAVVTMYIVGDSGAQTASVINPTLKGHGGWDWAPPQAETNYDCLELTPVSTPAAIPQTVTIYTWVDVEQTDLSSLATSESVDDLSTLLTAVSSAVALLQTTTNSLASAAGQSAISSLATSINSVVGVIHSEVGSLTTLVGDVPTNSEFQARTMVSSLYAKESTLGDMKGAGWSGQTLRTIQEAIENGATAGFGAILYTVTVTTVDGYPIDGVEVWITTDELGANVIAGTNVSDTDGNVDFMLDAGTYYVWKQHTGYSFTNPQEITVS